MSRQFIEIFLYLDPLGKSCYRVTKTIRDFRKERPEKIKLRVIPMVNYRRVYGHTRKKIGEDRASFVERNNRYSTNTYQACLGFHASSMQGKNKGLQFLAMLQEEVIDSRIDFTEPLIFEIAEKIGLDLESFKEDYASDFVRKMYKKSLNLAAEMKIRSTPSAVVYKEGYHDEAIRLGEEIEREILHAVCGLEEIKETKDGEEIIEEVKEELGKVLHFSRK